MYEIKQNYLPASHRLRPGRIYEKTSITIHSTANPTSTVYGERNWLTNTTNKAEAAWHDVVGAGIVINAIPHKEECWHSGTTEGNRHSIGIEIVESGDRRAVLLTAAEYVADLLYEYGWGLDKLKKHYDWTKKNCPRILIDKTYIVGGMDWYWFLARVTEFLEALNKPGKKIGAIMGTVIIDGIEREVEMVNVDGYNYVKLRGFVEYLGYNIGNKGKTPVLTKKA